MPNGHRSGLSRSRRNELYKEAQRALHRIPAHTGPIPTVRGYPLGWTRQGLMWNRLEALEVFGALYRLELDRHRDMLDGHAKEYVESVNRVRRVALDDPLTGQAPTRPLRMRPPRSAS